MATTGNFSIRYTDYDAEPSTASGACAVLTAVNFDAQAAAYLSFRDALAAITKGLRVGYSHGLDEQTLAAKTAASDPLAQREIKWLVRYTDGVVDPSKTHRMEIPGADLTFLDPNNRGYADLDDADVAAFVSAFEAFVLSPAGNAVTVDSIQFIGANL